MHVLDQEMFNIHMDFQEVTNYIYIYIHTHTYVGDTWYYIHMDFQEVTNYNIPVRLSMLLQPLVFVMGFGSEVY